MTKQKEIEKIKTILKVPEKDYILVHFRGKFTAISGDKAEDITLAEACKLIQDNFNIEIKHFIWNEKKWNDEKSRLVGSDPDLTLPQIFEGLPNVQYNEVFEIKTIPLLIDLWTSNKGGYVWTKEPEYKGEQCVAPGTIEVVFPKNMH